MQGEEQDIKHKITAAMIVLTLVAGGLISMFGNVNVLADGSGTYPAPGTGHWIIANETYVGNETIIMNGNITIQNGGSLTLRNVTLIMNCTFDGEFQIEVLSGGSLYIYDNDNWKGPTHR